MMRFPSIVALSLLLSLAALQGHAQWSAVSSPTSQDLYAVHFPTASVGYAVGYHGTVIRSTDAGLSWTAVATPDTGHLNTLWFHTADDGYVAGDSGMFHTSDGGASWVGVGLPVAELLRDITFSDALTGYCVGDNGTLLKTTDGGATWASKPTGSNRWLSSVHFPVPDTGYVVSTGYNWGFLRSTDAGETWTTHPIQPVVNLSSLEVVHFTDATTGYIGGWYIAALVKTHDAGATWTNLDSANAANLYDIDFHSPTTGFAVGFHNTIHHTTDAGATWQAQTPVGIAHQTLYAIHLLNDSTGIIVGSNGTILRTSNGGTPLGVHVPQKNLAMVFPNPAQDVLTVHMEGRFAVTLTLYDLLGHPILASSLTDKQAQVDLAGMASGLYFYTLTQGEGLVQAGKLVKQ